MQTCIEHDQLNVRNSSNSMPLDCACHRQVCSDASRKGVELQYLSRHVLFVKVWQYAYMSHTRGQHNGTAHSVCRWDLDVCDDLGDVRSS